MSTITRKRFDRVADGIVAGRVESFIAGQRNGAGTWPDQSVVPIDSVSRGATLHIIDKVGTDSGGPLRHIQLRRGHRVVVTLVYNHFTQRLVQTF